MTMQSSGKVYRESKGLIEQLCPVKMACKSYVDDGGNDAEFILSDVNDDVGLPIGLLDLGISKLARAYLIMLGRAENFFDGENYIQKNVDGENLWQMNIDGGDFVNLSNGFKNDGAIEDGEWHAAALGVIHPFTYMFNITTHITSINNRIGIKILAGRAWNDGIEITIDVYVRYMWRL